MSLFSYLKTVSWGLLKSTILVVPSRPSCLLEIVLLLEVRGGLGAGDGRIRVYLPAREEVVSYDIPVRDLYDLLFRVRSPTVCLDPEVPLRHDPSPFPSDVRRPPHRGLSPGRVEDPTVAGPSTRDSYFSGLIRDLFY